ncbi:MAG: hypothetical protein US35_C0019G0029 [Parcubacteria group bacterium GW2011_GWA2_37_10]|nr:MAG: hypothetical protein US35_C0019G0029 [Parcubacteria group bacterium GW2011_GWA2_37_10]
MHEIILTAILILVILYAIYLSFQKRAIWEDLQVEKIRREWDLAYFYYQTHQQDFAMLTKDYFFADYPLLKKVFAESKIEEIKDYLKKGSSDILPYFNNVDKFKKRFLR